MPQRTLQQLRLEHAWRCASDTERQIEGEYDDFVDAVKNLPVQITANGLGQALAYLAAEGLSDHGDPVGPEGHLYRHVESWLTGREELEDATAPKGTYAKQPDKESETASTPLIYRVAQGSSTRYRRGTSEALDYLAVLRFVSEAVGHGPYEAPESLDGKASSNSSGDLP